MAYKMEYEMSPSVDNTTKTAKMKVKVNPKKWIIAGALIAFLALCAFTDILIPGDAEVTKAAMNELVDDVRGGEQVVDAFAAFCHTVLEGG